MSTPRSALRHVVCPFCSLLCDDLELSPGETGGFHLERPACPRAAAGFERTPGDASARVGQRPVPQEQAVTAAAELLRGARQVLLGGLGLDVAGMRAAVRLAEQNGAVLDHAAGDALHANLRVLQRQGGYNTTLAEVKNRADLLLLTGTTATDAFPRFLDRISWHAPPPQPRFGGQQAVPLRRRLCYLGQVPRGRDARRNAEARPTLRLPCTHERLPAALDALTRGLRTGKLPAQSSAARPTTRELQGLLNALGQANYCVAAWNAQQFPAHLASSIITALHDLVQELNLRTRAAGLPLGGSDGAATAVHVCTWQSGYPLRVSYQRGYPEYDPQTHTARRLLESDATEAILWVDAFKREPPRPRRAPLVMLCPPPAPGGLGDQDVYLPIGTPGLDHAGSMFRCDNVISLRLGALHDNGPPAAAHVLDAIRSAAPPSRRTGSRT